MSSIEAATSDRILFDVMQARSVNPQGLTTSSPTGRRMHRRRTVLGLVGAGLAGFLGGVDVLLFVLLESLLRGIDADAIDIPGMGFAAWSPANGLEYGFGPAMIAVLVVSTLVGVAIGWAVGRRRRA